MDMDKLVALCKRRGFLFQSSEIYGGLNGFWDYGPLGVELKWDGPLVSLTTVRDFSSVLGPDAREPGTLTEPREFNLMFKTYVGALSGEEGAAFLRPETAQGIFVNFKNVCDSTRVRIPFGIAQMGKSFRNEITPKQFTFRSREFEQMEIEFFCHPRTSPGWYKYWRDRRFRWYTDLGLASAKLR